MLEELQTQTAAIIKDALGVDATPEFTRPQAEHGDYATNVALQLSGKLGKSPREIAEVLAANIVDQLGMEATVAGPGFINIRLSNQAMYDAALKSTQLKKPLLGKTTVAEYSDPNPFKVLHAGHLYTSLVGDAVANIMETAGTTMHRVNFGGDVGLHVGRCMWAIMQELGGEEPSKLAAIDPSSRLDWLSANYVKGTEAYRNDENARQAIIEINKRVYALHETEDKQSPFAQIYWTCRQWSYDGFDELYARLGMVPFEKYYPESSVSELGLKTVKDHVGSVYEESDGAVIFRGEAYGLFTQVFINSEGLPTYAGKDVGLIQHKFKDYHYDNSFIITDVSQKDHLAVVMKSIEQFEPELVKRSIHHTHGRIKFADGRKMSSREGNVVTAADVLDATYEAANSSDEQIVLGAVRYSFLKNKIGGDINYDPKSSVSLEGDSGPYLQYALVRAKSILAKAPSGVGAPTQADVNSLDEAERSLARALSQYPEAFDAALADYSPHHICNYLYNTAAAFNRFYEKSRVIDHERSVLRLNLVQIYHDVLQSGLTILGMPQPERM